MDVKGRGNSCADPPTKRERQPVKAERTLPPQAPVRQPCRTRFGPEVHDSRLNTCEKYQRNPATPLLSQRNATENRNLPHRAILHESVTNRSGSSAGSQQRLALAGPCGGQRKCNHPIAPLHGQSVLPSASKASAAAEVAGLAADFAWITDARLDGDGIAEEKWWSRAGSNRRPLECHSSALPAELRPRAFRRADSRRFRHGGQLRPIRGPSRILLLDCGPLPAA